MDAKQDNTIQIERTALIATIMASSMAFIDSTALNVALPAIQTDLNATGAQLLWIVNAYLLMLASLILVGGSLGDKFGRNRVFGGGISLFLLASLACGLAPDINFLIGARTLQGIGGALMIPGSLAVLNANTREERRGQAIGTWSAATTVVTLIGPLLGGILAQAGLWRWVFIINLPIGLPVLNLVFRRLPESYDAEAGALDIPGVILAVLALGGLAFGFISAPDQGFGHPLVYLALRVGVVCLILFMVNERFSKHAMMPLGLFKSGTFSGANLLTLFLYGALSAVTFFLSLNLVQIQGYPETLAGLALIPFSILLALLSRLAGRWADLHGPRRILIVGPALVGVSFFLLSLPGLTGGPADYWTSFFPGIIFFGLGMGLTVAPLTTAVMGAVPERNFGTASGVNNAVSRIAGVLAIAILGSLALFSFQGDLMQRVGELNLSQQAMQAIQAGASELAGTQVPEAVAAQQVDAVSDAIRLAYVDTFQMLMVINGVLAFLGAAASFVLISDPDSHE
jgi:EmrB/QacA subfamily drug resistance transporter